MKKYLILLIIFLLVGCSDETISFKEDYSNDEEYKLVNVLNHYNKYVKTNKETKLYDKDNNEVGNINNNIDLILDDTDVTSDTKVFKIKDLDYYINYEDVSPVKDFNYDNRYKRYVVFNENVKTTSNTTFYNDKGYAYKINKGVSLPIIVKDKDKYYVEYNNQLLYVKKNDCKIEKKNNTKAKTRKNIRTFTYHAVYKEGDKCKNKSICHPYKQFDEQMKYLHDNNYLTLTMEELEMFLDKKINIPTKTVVITLDDGNLAKNAIEVLDKYQLYATYFVITGKYKAYTIKSDYVNYESHTDNLHQNYKCPGGEQGGLLLCEKEDVVLKDLKTSQEKLGGSFAISYPFFDWNERAFKLLKKSGFRLAFIGQWNSEGYSDFNTNRLMLRRKTIFSTDSLELFKSYLV